MKVCFGRIIAVACASTSLWAAGGSRIPLPWGVLKGGGESSSDSVLHQSGIVEINSKNGTAGNVDDFPNNSLAKDGLRTKQERQQKWRSLLPDELRSKRSKSLQKLRLGQTEIYLLGTAHVSNDSAADTRILLNHVRPECIFVELCDMRISLLEGSSDDKARDGKNLTFFQKVREAREAEGCSHFFAMSSILLTSWQEDFATDLGVELGGEFRQAHRYWLQHPSAHLVLGDRPLTLTLNRGTFLILFHTRNLTIQLAWESLSLWPKVKVVLGLLWSSLRKPKKSEIRQWLDSIMKEESDVLTKSMAELRKSFPTLYTSIIEERDAWLAAKLLQTCRALQGQNTTVVALIGAGHVEGVCRWLTKPSPETPEKVLSKLVWTKRWAGDDIVQKEAIPAWIHHVSELHRP